MLFMLLSRENPDICVCKRNRSFHPSASETETDKWSKEMNTEQQPAEYGRLINNAQVQ